MREVRFEYPSPKFRILYPEYSRGKKHIILKGGRASTKSWSVAMALLDHCRTYNGLQVMCGREVQNSIAESSKRLLDNTIGRLGLGDEFKSTNTYIEHKDTGSFIRFMGMEGNHESIKGLESYDIFWVEEAQSVTDGSLEVLIPTMRAPGAQIWYTYNPNLPTTPIESVPRRYPDQTLVESINYTEVLKYLDANTIAEAEADRADNEERYNWIWLGQYRAQSQDTYIPLRLVTGAVARRPTLTNEPVVAGLDIGLFHDRCVLVVRQGPNVIYTREWKDAVAMDVVDQVEGYMNRYGVVKLAVDANGQGAAVYQELYSRMGEKVVGIMAGAASRQQSKYSKLRDEAWGRLKEWLETGSLPADRERDWITDLTNIKYFYDEKGRYKIESKKSYLGRGFHSTDWADALSYSLLVDAGTASAAYWQGGGEVEYRRERFGIYGPSDWMGI